MALICLAGPDGTRAPCRYLAVHGGIGRLTSIDQIRSAQRPLMESGLGDDDADAVLYDCVWYAALHPLSTPAVAI